MVSQVCACFVQPSSIFTRVAAHWATEPTLGAYVLATFSKISTWRQMGVLALSGAAGVFLHVFGVYSNDGWLHHDPRLAFFAPTK